MLPGGGSMAAGLQSAWINFFAHSYRHSDSGVSSALESLSYRAICFTHVNGGCCLFSGVKRPYATYPSPAVSNKRLDGYPLS